MKPWHFHEDVPEEVERPESWYDARERGLGDDFIVVLDTVLARLEEGPAMAVPAPEDVRARRVLLPRFPFAIVFVELDDHYLVVAVAHLKRKPGYWLTRLGE